MEIVKIELSKLREDPLNLRRHGVENLEMIKKSLREYTQYKPLIVDRNTMTVMIGNGRLQAMRALGWKEADCILVDFNEHEGLEVIDNRLNELSSWADRSIDEWLFEEKGVEWWGVDSRKAERLLKRRKAEESKEKPVEEKPKKQPLVCPCCGKPVHKVMEALL